MCIAIPGEIIELSNREAKVNIMDVETTVNIQLIDSPKVGDYILIHTGCAIEKIDKSYFNNLTDIFKEILDKDENGNE